MVAVPAPAALTVVFAKEFPRTEATLALLDFHSKLGV
jgi:hypothetical protein